MSGKKFFGCILLLFSVALTGCANETPVQYSNPIDAYFLPEIETAETATRMGELQNTYRGVWKAELTNIMNWLDDRFIYADDKEAADEYARCMELMISATHELAIATYFSQEERERDQNELGYRGNVISLGFYNRLNQVKAEMYRDAGMRIIDHVKRFTGDEYVFLDIDYENEHYE